MSDSKSKLETLEPARTPDSDAGSEGIRNPQSEIRDRQIRNPQSAIRDRQSVPEVKIVDDLDEIRNPKSEIRNSIVFDDVSKFYGEILGVNRVNLEISPGITSLVGPNGAGKSTLMNLMTGLLRPSRGQITILGIPTDQPEQLFRKVGYCTQFDSFPRGRSEEH